jgi:hypothetical protein
VSLRLKSLIFEEESGLFIKAYNNNNKTTASIFLPVGNQNSITTIITIGHQPALCGLFIGR